MVFWVVVTDVHAILFSLINEKNDCFYELPFCFFFSFKNVVNEIT